MALRVRRLHKGRQNLQHVQVGSGNVHGQFGVEQVEDGSPNEVDRGLFEEVKERHFSEFDI